VADYRFETTWRLAASQAHAWAVLFDGEGWTTWWPSVRQAELLMPGAPDGLGRRLRYRFTTRLPYTLTFEAQLVEVTEPTRLVAVASGELAGRWTCDLVQDGEYVVVRPVGAVRTPRRWMNALAPVVRPVFAWNHAALMREGGHGFAAHLGTSGHVEGDGEQRRTSSKLLVAAVAVAMGLLVRAARRRAAGRSSRRRH
jgi:hypothetical protein